MKILRLITMVALVTFLFSRCETIIPEDGASSGNYTITVENISTNYLFFESGVKTIQEGSAAAGPALPGGSFKFSFHAGPNHKLSFATMYGFSNDGFYAPEGTGISLYSDPTTPVTGDITDKIMLWDAGTEVNQMPGADNKHDGANESNAVQLMSAVADGYDYGTVATNLKVTLDYGGNSMFTVTVENLAGSTTAISPVVWVVHTKDNPLFEAGKVDYEKGLEEIAESGNTGPLGQYLSMNSGYVSPIAPVLWVLQYKRDRPIFTLDSADYGKGLETLAEMGNPEPLYQSLLAAGYTAGVQSTNTAGGTGPILPGQMYRFSIHANGVKTLSLACMLGASNDIFFSTGEDGINLSKAAAMKNITSYIKLYDAGTEVNEYPGAQTQANTVEGGNVRMLNDSLPWPKADQVIKVTVYKN
jgi:hypothetical protein